MALGRYIPCVNPNICRSGRISMEENLVPNTSCFDAFWGLGDGTAAPLATTERILHMDAITVTGIIAQDDLESLVRLSRMHSIPTSNLQRAPARARISGHKSYELPCF